MRFLLSNAKRVLLAMFILACVGLYCGFNLPISLFPNSTRPGIFVRIDYGGMAPDLFRQQYGSRFESSVKDLRKDDLKVEKVVSRYRAQSLTMVLTFNWGADPDAALRETRTTIESIASTLPEEIRRSISFSPEGNEVGMILTFTSEKRPLDEVFRLLEPQLLPRIEAIQDVQLAELGNPLEKEIEIVLKPEAVIQRGLSPQEIQQQISIAAFGQSGGTLKTEDGSWQISRNAMVIDFNSLIRLPIRLRNGHTILLSEIASIAIRPSSRSSSLVKTDGVRSLAMLVYPKQGGNLNAMAHEVHRVIQKVKQDLPVDIKYRSVIDKSETVKSSIAHVGFEVLLGSLLATFILYLFVGNLRNVLTAAIEIPMSMILAFIVMKMVGININLFSLAGLALAAGMNVDASVVVMDNIFRHLQLARERRKTVDVQDVIIQAVQEVKWPVLISTLASLVVFIPFLALDGLGKALLGDLVKAVIFSHGLSAIVALILVPTFRSLFGRALRDQPDKKAPAEDLIAAWESWYIRLLQGLLQNRGYALAALSSLSVMLLVICAWILPRLPTEIVGKPDSDWLIVTFQAQGNTLVRQLEADVEPYAKLIKEKLGDEILISAAVLTNPSGGMVAVRIKDKSRMVAIESELKSLLKSQPDLTIGVETWNQGELSLPEAQAFRLEISGSTSEERAFAAEELARDITSLRLFERLEVTPRFNTQDQLSLHPQMDVLARLPGNLSHDELVDSLRLIGDGRWIGDLNNNQERTPIVMRYPADFADTMTKLKGMPVQVGAEVVALDALLTTEREPAKQSTVRVNGLESTTIAGFLPGPRQYLPEADQQLLADVVRKVQKKREADQQAPLVFSLVEPNPDETQAIRQLSIALAVAILLLYLTIYFHFGNLADSLLVMLAVPFALTGSLIALWLFSSTLSLNSILGITLLSGIAVNNSIMLVDFMKISEKAGHTRLQAVIEAAKARLRPILITSLTTILGMLPIALGFGEGGKVLSPLGISVAGGLLLSTSLTLICLPILQSMRSAKGTFPVDAGFQVEEVVC